MFNYKSRQQKLAPSPGLFTRLKIFRIFFKVWFRGGLNRKSLFIQVFNFRNIVVVLLLFALAVPSYAYNSPEVVNGSLFYGVKRNLESFEYNLVHNESEKQEKEIKFAERRLDEISVMLEDKKADKNIIETINEVEDIFVRVDDSVAKGNLDIGRHVEKITTLAQQAGLDNEVLTDSLATTIEELKKASTQERTNAKQEFHFVEPKDSKSKPAQGNTVDSPQKNNINNSKVIELDIENMEIEIKLKKTYLTGEYEKNDLIKLEENLQAKMKKAKKAVVDKDDKGAQEYIKKTKVLNDNAEYFMKLIESNNDPGSSNGGKKSGKNKK